MNYKKSILLLIFLVFCSLFFSLFLANNFGTNTGYINDYSDRLIYAGRGSWYSLSKAPYTEVKSEYPQLATLVMAAPYFILNSINSADAKDAQEIFDLISGVQEPSNTNPNALNSIHLQNELFLNYAMIFSLIMMIFLFLSVLLLYEMRINKKYLAFLVLLPASLYFSYNRFDIVMCFLSLFSLYLLYRNYFKLSALLLVIGFFMKWYLLVLLPVFLVYYYCSYQKINWSMILVFCAICLLIVLSTVLWIGFEGFLVPYKLQFSRGMDQPSMMMIIYRILLGIIEKIGFISIDLYNHIYNSYVLRVAFLLQFSVIPLCLTSKIDTFEKVVKWSALSVLVFILFAKINSPQWILWVSPFLILLARDRKYILGIITLDLITYLQYPITFNLYLDGQISSNLLLFVYGLRIILLIMFALHILSQVIGDNYIYRMIKNRHYSKALESR